MKAVLLLAIVLCSKSLLAQTPQTFTVKPGVNILDVIPLEAIYLYPHFTTGTVLFKDKRTVTGLLNFNVLLNAIQFIDPKGDTLSLAEEHLIKLVSLASDTFVYNNNFIRQLKNYPTARLAENEYFREFVQKPGSYGMSSGATSADNINVIVADRGYKLNTQQEVILTKQRDYFIGDRNGAFLRASRKNLVKLFPKHTTNINQYINKEKIDLGNKEDLYKLVAYISKL